jgi:ER membrane protein complex subunit 1
VYVIGCQRIIPCVVAGRNHRILSLPNRLLDPRRPNRKVTAEEQEEFLVQYDPILLDDPRRVLSHHYEVHKANYVGCHLLIERLRIL